MITDFNQYADWYKQDREFLQSQFKGDWQLIAALLSATSPQIHITISWQWTLRIYGDYIAGRRIRMVGLMRCHRANVQRALDGQELSGQKVRNFYQAIIGDTDAVVLDTWMLRLLKWYPAHKRIPTNRQYDKLADRFRAMAKANGYKPVEYQAILWIKYRFQNGYKPVSYSRIGQDEKQYSFADLY